MRPTPIIEGPEKSLSSRIFEYILGLQKSATQLKMNHWQTESYAEHKANDKFVKILLNFADDFAEAAMGELGRPKINTFPMTISDRSITSTKWVLENIKSETNEIIQELRISEFEGLLALVGDFDAELKKAIYLITLG